MKKKLKCPKCGGESNYTFISPEDWALPILVVGFFIVAPICGLLAFILSR